ncbi:MAG: hypothetical protein H7343_14020 [Undibacterium sp.]|nr:hypothetical protein [Opitutaceae bacterium]
MNFEELESTWSLQQPAPPQDAALLKLAMRQQLARRRRVLGLTALGTAAGLLLLPVLFYLNLHRAPVVDPAVSLLRLLLNLGAGTIVMTYLLRQLGRQRTIERSSGESVRAMLTLAVASVEAEMADYRRARWLGPLVVISALFSAFINQPVSHVDWSQFAVRAALILALVIPMALIMWRHYRRHLAGEHARLLTTLRQFD